MNAIKKIFRFLFFRFQKDDVFKLNSTDLILGLIITWGVGIGRYWDDPGAHIGQYLGLGSLVYVFVLALILLLILLPFKIENLNYKKILTFITLTSLPAALYAIPVERFMTIPEASRLNAQFLAIVAIWRVAIYWRFLWVIGFNWFRTTILAFLPLTLIVTCLTLLNLERAVFRIMGGFRQETPANDAYDILVLLTLTSAIAVGPLVLSFLGLIAYDWKKSKRLQESRE